MQRTRCGSSLLWMLASTLTMWVVWRTCTEEPYASWSAMIQTMFLAMVLGVIVLFVLICFVRKYSPRLQHVKVAPSLHVVALLGFAGTSLVFVGKTLSHAPWTGRTDGFYTQSKIARTLLGLVTSSVFIVITCGIIFVSFFIMCIAIARVKNICMYCGYNTVGLIQCPECGKRKFLDKE